MSAKILNGKTLSLSLQEELKKDIFALRKKIGIVPKMVNIMIGDDHGACAYARAQKKVAENVGIDYELKSLPEGISQEDFVCFVKKSNEDKAINGILIHKPVPAHLNYEQAASYVDALKDLEGINAFNLGKMILEETNIIPCTPASVMAHLESIPVDLYGKEIVIVGHSMIVGRPLSLLLLNAFATVTICHKATSQAGKLIEHVNKADILIVAVGKASIIKGEWIKEGAIVIDVGINQMGSKIVGDIDFKEAEKRASHITPVPGGVGPVTVVMLMQNAIEALKEQYGIKDRLSIKSDD